MIRKATHVDINRLYELCVEAHSKSPYSAIELDELKVRKLVAKFTTKPSAFCWVTDDVTGVLAADISEIAWSRKRCTDDMMFYCEAPGDGSALLRKYIAWAKEQKVAMWGLSVSFGFNQRTHDLLERHGLKHIGGIYIEVAP